MVVGRSVCVRGDVPTGREDKEVREWRLWVAGLRRQDTEDRRVHVIDRDGADVDELCKVVLVRHVVSVPGDDIKWTVTLAALEELAPKLVHDAPRIIVRHLVGGDGVQKVAGVGKAISAEWTELGKLKVGAPDLQDVASRGALNVDLESLATLDDADLSRLHVEESKLGLDVQRPLLGHDKEVTVRVDEGILVHALVAQEDMGGDTLAQRRVSRACDGLQPVNKVHVFTARNVEWLPGQLCGRHVNPRVQGQEG